MQLRQLLLALAALSLVQHCFLGPRQNEAGGFPCLNATLCNLITFTEDV